MYLLLTTLWSALQNITSLASADQQAVIIEQVEPLTIQVNPSLSFLVGNLGKYLGVN